MRALVSAPGYNATLTTDHALSSYGQPVLVIDDRGYGPVMVVAGPLDPIDDGDGRRPAWQVVADAVVSPMPADRLPDVTPAIDAGDPVAGLMAATTPTHVAEWNAQWTAARDLALAFVAVGKAAARHHSAPSRKAIWAAIAQYSGKDAGHVCYGRTKDEARQKAAKCTSMTVLVRRELATQEQIDALARVGKI